MNIAVAMAVYRGERYLPAQLCSVLAQLLPDDELVISYDKPTGIEREDDPTWHILTEAAEGDARVRLIDGPCRGAVANFENAIGHCEKELIFLCDQDDVWLPHKREAVVAAFAAEDVALVMHDAAVTDAELTVTQPSFFETRGSRAGFWRNVMRNSYIGCCMAFRRALVPRILPFPQGIPMHDQWIGLLAQRMGRVVLLPQPLIYYRRHGHTVTTDRHAGAAQMLAWRVRLLRCYRRRRTHGS